ncbi:LysR family transcriptional regulator [Alteromonas sp. C1M14]|uniref:LysR family transcriptional regulator n=1 Tax=Alteromonas sp. C1M14 TaxID=2841567 RepID=UPI001C09ECA7|nr:LysR family transcriptional regulator [Alteromonas sp. C1M14]MBU2977615.1 LysR family transcriptional regulator [Alteromonas sp. C1M14]
MRLRHIEVFHAIYTTGSITGAAHLLYVSQPSVSKVLAHAEQQLGFALFHRHKGKLSPTAEADMMFPEIDRIYQQLNTVKQLASNIRRGRSGLINIAVTPALGFDVLPKAMALFNQAHPNVAINIKTVHNTEALQSLVEHKCDAAVLFSSPTMPGVTERTLSKQDLVVMYPKKAFATQPEALSLDELISMDIIGIWESGPLGEMAWRHIEQSGLDIQTHIQVDTYYIAAKLVHAGLGCCIVDRLTAQGNLTKETGIARFSPSLNFDIKALSLTDRPLAKVCDGFLDTLTEVINTVSQ